MLKLHLELQMYLPFGKFILKFDQVVSQLIYIMYKLFR
jgi:hypothetical protein